MAGKYSPYPAYRDSGNTLLGNVPKHWVVKRLKYVSPNVTVGVVVNPSTYFEDGGTVLFLRGVDISRDKITTENVKKMSEASNAINSKSTLREGDLVSMRVGYPGVTAVIPRDLDGANCASLLIIRKPNEISSRLLCYQINTDIGRNQIKLLQQGAAQEQINVSDIVNFWVVCPPQNEATKVEQFLDHETAKIDTLIEKQQQLIQLLKEKRQAVISNAVTKGLNPNAPMKDSGVEWLGEVPEHWNVCRLKQIIKSGSSISYGIVQPGDALDDGVPFVQTTNMSQGNFDLDELQKTTEEIARSYPRSRLDGGEVILGIRASIGAAFVVPEHLKGANLSRGVARIIPNESITSSFLVSYFRTDSVKRYWSLSKQGSTFSEVSIETVRELTLPIPPVSEQVEISNFVKHKLEVLENIIENAVEQKQLLQERRTALISAAVTGKIDVRNFSAQLT